MVRFIVAVLLACTSLTAFADPKRYDVKEIVGQVDESLESFVMRVAPELDSFTRQSGYEACGMIAQTPSGNQFGVRLITIKGAMTCSMLRSNVPEGMRALKVSIHSHPHKRSVFPTAADVSYYAENPMVSGRMVKRGSPEKVGGAYFSQGDYRAGPGYLVAEGRLLYQEGVGTERDIGTYAAPMLTGSP